MSTIPGMIPTPALIRLRRAAALLVLLGLWLPSAAQATAIALDSSYAGYINFVTTGATMRTQSNAGNACAVTTGPVSATVSGIPAGSTIRHAFLYWGGSGSTADNTVTFAGSTINASQTYSDTYFLSGSYDLDYFGAMADVTAQVTGNGSYTLNNLTVTNTDQGGLATYCSSAAVTGGWGLLVIYENTTTEPLRVINIYDGLQWFRGSSITLTPSNFNIPASPINGKIAVLSLEGDVDNSGASGGFTEGLTFNSNALTDALNPTGNQFNSTINILSSNTSYGFDFDEYSVSPYLSAGQTSATTVYSSGGDLVLLMLQAVSVTSVPVSDMQVSKARINLLGENGPGQYRIRVTNNGPLVTLQTTTVTDTIAAGQTYSGFTSSDPNWNCTFSSPTVTCTYPAGVASGTTLADLFLNVTVTAAAGTGINNTATVSGGNSFDHISANNTSTVSSTVTSANVSTSVKTVIDMNGGDVAPGDVLRYEIEIIETAGAGVNNVRVTDNVPANVSGFTLLSYPAGATNNSLPAGGSNGTGFVDISGFSLAANGTETISFDVTVNSVSPGTVISNTANITQPANVVRAIGPTSVTVLAASVPGSGVKNLYMYPNAAFPLTNALSRTVPTVTSTSAIASVGGSVTLTQTPVLARALTLSAGNIPVYACMQRTGTSQNRTVTVALSYFNGTGFTAIGATAAFPTFNSTTYGMYTATVSLASAVTIPAGRYIRAVITNTTGTATRPVNLTTNNANCGAGVHSRVALNAATVINIDAFSAWTASYNGGTAVTSVYNNGQTLHARALVSDPFGSADITGATFELRNAGGTTVLGPSAMTLVNTNAGAGERTYELAFTVPTHVNSPYTLRAVAAEGTEGTVTDLGLAGLVVLQALPVLTVTKTASTPTVAPGVPFTYSVLVSNTGTGNATTVAIMDMLGKFTALRLNTYGAGQHFQFVDGSPSSTLGLGTPVYSNNDGATYVYVPSSGGGGAPAGYDTAITNFRVPMTGTMPPGSSFTVNYQAAPD